jgi:hypothetical protein
MSKLNLHFEEFKTEADYEIKQAVKKLKKFEIKIAEKPD